MGQNHPIVFHGKASKMPRGILTPEKVGIRRASLGISGQDSNRAFPRTAIDGTASPATPILHVLARNALQTLPKTV